MRISRAKPLAEGWVNFPKGTFRGVKEPPIGAGTGGESRGRRKRDTDMAE